MFQIVKFCFHKYHYRLYLLVTIITHEFLVFINYLIVFDVKYEFTTSEIKAISDRCFYKNKNLKEIKRIFRALAKM